MDIMLRFPDEATARAKLSAYVSPEPRPIEKLVLKAGITETTSIDPQTGLGASVYTDAYGAEVSADDAYEFVVTGYDYWLTASHAHALDPIGPIVTAPAEVDEEGNVITPAVVDEGFHVNLRVLSGDTQAGLEPYTVHPAEPKRVWA